MWQKLLEDTRQGIKIITLEVGKALPGYSVLMSPPLVPVKAAKDNTKLRAVAGLATGLFLRVASSLMAGLLSRRVNYSDTLKRSAHLAPIKTTTPRGKRETAQADRLRNALQLHPLRVPPLADGTWVIAITRLDTGPPDELALSLAMSFAEARSHTLLIDADAREGRLTERLGKTDAAGWRDALEGKGCTPISHESSKYLDILPIGHKSGMTDAEIGIGRVRTALAGLKSDYELVILLCGSLSDSISSELLLSVSDLALAEVRPHDHKARIATQIGELDSLPRQGGVLTFSAAYRGDPGLRHATEAADHCLCHHCAAVVAFAFLPHFTEHPS